MQYPHAPRATDQDVLHGVTIADPYRWLEDADDERTRAWQANQRELYLRHRERWAHSAEWAASLVEALADERSSAPVVRGARTFFVRATKRSEHPAVCVAEGGETRVLLDALTIDPTGDTVLEDWDASAEGELVAYQISRNGTEDCELLVLDVATGQVVDGPIDRVRRTSVGWLAGGGAFYYVRRRSPESDGGDKLYHRRVFLHRLGTDPAEDILIFGNNRPANQYYTVAVTPDGRWLTISTVAGRSPHNELWLADLSRDNPAQPRLTPVHVDGTARTHTRIAPGTSRNEPMWLRTTLAAPRGRVVATTPADPGPETWRTIIAERDDAVLKDFLPMTGGRLTRPVALVTWQRHAVSEVTLHDLCDSSELGTVKLPGVGNVGPLRTYPWPSHEAWFSYTDHATPTTIFHFDACDKVLRTETASSYDQSRCRVTMDTAVSRDGTSIRIFIISPAGEPDRPRPTILTGYGGFGVAMAPTHNPDIVAWVRAGGVFAVACLRGGSEEGTAWHRAGMGRNKQRVFEDFDAVTDHLVRQGWTSYDKLGIKGSSNGGLLIATALTQHPEKYGAAASLAPLTDMIRYERTGLGPSWRAEYGTVDNLEDFTALLAYSPYHRVQAGVPYPPVLVGVFESDSRVDPAHGRKFTAALQHASAEPVVLRAEDNVGHGSRSTSREIGLQADVLAFFGHFLGLCPSGDRCDCSACS